MSVNVTTAFVQQYKANVAHLLQQKGSRLRDKVMFESISGAKAASLVEQIGSVTATLRTTRHGDTPLISTPHDKRWVTPADYDVADLIDNTDKLRMIVNLSSPYAQNHAYALGRAMDTAINTAFWGTALTGENGSTSTVFDTDNNVAVNFESSGNVGLTVAKMREAKRLLMSNNVDVENDPLFMAVTAQQHDDLLKEVQVANLDYNDRPVLVQGKVVSFMGFNLVHTELLTNTATPYRRIPAWAKSGMCLAMWNDIEVRISERADKNYSTQVFATATFGATRLEEDKVIEILCNEA